MPLYQKKIMGSVDEYIDGLVQDWSNAIANALGLLH